MPPLTDQTALVAGMVTTAVGLLIWAADKIVGSLLEHRTVEHLRRKRAGGRSLSGATDDIESQKRELELKLHIMSMVAHEAFRQRDVYRDALIAERELRKPHTAPPIERAEKPTSTEADQ